MRHHVAGRKLGVKTAHRLAMLSNLASSLVIHNKIETTLPRAKELKRLADKVVTLSKRGTVHATRKARQILRNRDAVTKAFKELPERFAKRNGGYTRILKLGFRHGDNAPMAIIEYLPGEGGVVVEKTEKKGKKKAEKEVAKVSKERVKKAPKKESIKDILAKKLGSKKKD